MNTRNVGRCLLLAVLLTPAATSPAQTPGGDAGDRNRQEEIDRLRRELDEVRELYAGRLADLERRLAALEGAAAATGAALPATAEPPPAVAPPVTTQVTPGASKIFNPDISVIGNFLGAGGKNAFSEQPALQLSEAELSFQAIIDPYARADVYLAASPEGLEIEEGFATFTGLPAALLLKAGKMRAQFGKVNTLHTHALPTADRPLVTENLVGGEEGISNGGVSLSHLIDNPFLFLEVTGEVFHGDSTVFQGGSRADLTYVGRVRGYRDLTEATNLDLGVSFAHGPTIPGLFPPVRGTLQKNLIGVDATFRYRPLRRAIYRRLNLRTELVWSRQELPNDALAASFGFYGLAEYQFARRWYAGARADRSGLALDGSRVDKGGSVFLTFWPSEFSQVRGQYRRTRYAEFVDANEFLFQINFSIGAHGAHVF